MIKCAFDWVSEFEWLFKKTIDSQSSRELENAKFSCTVAAEILKEWIGLGRGKIGWELLTPSVSSGTRGERYREIRGDTM